LTETTASLVASTQGLADEVLFPAALSTDAADVVPVDLLDSLADTGLYGLTGTTDCGGLDADLATVCAIVEALAGGCLTTTFVWMQHLGAVRATCTSDRPARATFAEALCRGRSRAGVAFAHLRRPGPAMLAATAVDGGWRLDGTAPWVTGWGRIDLVHIAARLGDDIVWLLVDAREAATLSITPLTLAAVNASATVELTLRGHIVADDRVTTIEPLRNWLVRDGAGLRTNGSLALGVARRCCTLLGPSPLDDAVDACRCALDAAGIDALPAARAEATALAMRAASALVAAGGGRSIVVASHAQRLAREAMFLLVQGQTAAIRAAQARLLRTSD